MTDLIRQKQDQLKECLHSMGSVLVAFSSGVDSTFLLKMAHEVLGDHAVAVTARSGIFPSREYEQACAFCKKKGSVISSWIPTLCPWKDFAKILQTGAITANAPSFSLFPGLPWNRGFRVWRKDPTWMTWKITVQECGL